jgi:hypothetical protein
MSEHVEKEFHDENLIIFACTKDDGFRMAMLDKNSCIVKVISERLVSSTLNFMTETHVGGLGPRFSGHSRV